MRLIGVTIENFRCYESPVSVRFDDLTALVGRNDVGKSSLMDALAIFFEAATPDKDDACKSGNPKAMRITCEFDQLPAHLVVDTDFPTSLAAEHLLSPRQTLILRKTYNGSLATPKPSAIEAMALHPTAAGYNDLLTLKKSDLASRAAELGIDLQGVDKRINSAVRGAIWECCPDLELAEVSVQLEEEGGKQVWAALQPYLPTFALFKSDRASTDQDAEAQDPLKAAIREAVKAVEPKLQEVQEYVEAEVRKIAAATVEKLREMDPSVAETLDPVISTKKWESLFSTSITGDEGVPLNKRGSGVKRLVLLNFFRAKAEADALKKSAGSIIYAIEEPETSQHPRNQRLLLTALRDLASGEGRQVILTTHTPMLARYLPASDLRFIERRDDGTRQVSEGHPDILDRIAASLGVLPDHNVKIFVGVEGPNDIAFLRGIAKVLRNAGEDVPDLDRLELDGELIFIPLGGSNLASWASRLKHLNRPEFHICDRDNPPPDEPKYAAHMAEVNNRDVCRAVATQKREMENYLHHEAVQEAYQQNGHAINLAQPFGDFDDVPTIVARAVHVANGDEPWDELSEEKRRKKESRAKSQLNNAAVRVMTAERLNTTDPAGEIRNWFVTINQMMAEVNQ
ncbi:ATP-binding protein [Filomicrobium sp.]|uniref:ATP-binding protein n=1 Tax=Filomicrobium sp. TaxID=2024831 RepID=UPI0025856D16|nr:ATP-binding protein [Filomicrobium sp.]MCV0370508.1 ATP-binding protein [Filomicrobium sp.]